MGQRQMCNRNGEEEPKGKISSKKGKVGVVMNRNPGAKRVRREME